MVTKPFWTTGAWGRLGSWGTGGVGVWRGGSSQRLAHTLCRGQGFGRFVGQALQGLYSPTLHTRKLGLRRERLSHRCTARRWGTGIRNCLSEVRAPCALL